jgi:hypothetical protein
MLRGEKKSHGEGHGSVKVPTLPPGDRSPGDGR